MLPGKVILVGSKHDWKVCQELTDQIPEAVNMAGKTSLSSYFELLFNCSKCIATESNSPLFCSQIGIESVLLFRPEWATARDGYRTYYEKVSSLLVV